MSDMIAKASKWLESGRHVNLTEAINYEGEGETLSIQATIEEAEYEVEDQSGAITKIEATAFLMRFSDVTVTPQQGHKIKRSLNGTTQIYEVNAPADIPVWQWAEVSRQTIRVFAKYLKDE